MPGANGHIYGSIAWKRLRALVLARATVCGICGRPGTATMPLSTVDHIVPLSKGGEPFALSNVQAAHARCNFARRDGRPLKNQPIRTSRDW